ncbi:Gfo/Idh/MocA family protein [Gilliamella sp. wkB112]|uniref:Gfo/Idh/MocA family protein n=1 Tax=Gilliamella sp. wkB112 TaxID=3120257 RepID=UPI00080E3DA2|nr:Gfo/Idh/MocA family oxidoreductase [Gilliamella apicola]OCG01233.1 oxidoreductase [Gilliamella apicola]
MIRLAIIGTNWITDKFIEAALQTNKYQLSAVYSRSIDKAQLFAKKYHISTIYTDLIRLAKNPQIDAIYIASPNSLHFAQAKLMLENGKDVICEKPLTSNLEQTKALIDIAIDRQQVIFEALKTYHLPNYQQVRNYLPKLGKIRKVLLNYCQYSSRYPSYLKGENPNTFNPLFSNGSIMDIGVYPLNFAIGLWGKPTTISATSSLLESGVDAHGSVVMTYDDFEVIIWHSKVSNSYIPSEIQGEDGSLIINHLSVCQQVSYQPRQAELQDISVNQNSNEMYYEANYFAELCLQRQIMHNGLSNSLTSSALLTTIRQQTGVVFPTCI